MTFTLPASPKEKEILTSKKHFQVQNALRFGKEINMYLQEWPSALLSGMT